MRCNPLFIRGLRGAEGVGFEPTVGFPTPVFKTGAIDHSATPPLIGSLAVDGLRSLAADSTHGFQRLTSGSLRLLRGSGAAVFLDATDDSQHYQI